MSAASEARSRAKGVVLALTQSLSSLRRAARDLPPERAAALTAPVEREIALQTPILATKDDDE